MHHQSSSRDIIQEVDYENVCDVSSTPFTMKDNIAYSTIKFIGTEIHWNKLCEQICDHRMYTFNLWLLYTSQYFRTSMYSNIMSSCNCPCSYISEKNWLICYICMVWFSSVSLSCNVLNPDHMPNSATWCCHSVRGNLVIEQHDSTKLLLIMRCFDHHRCEQLQSLRD